jgi:hypothetical protein
VVWAEVKRLDREQEVGRRRAGFHTVPGGAA